MNIGEEHAPPVAGVIAMAPYVFRPTDQQFIACNKTIMLCLPANSPLPAGHHRFQQRVPPPENFSISCPACQSKVQLL
jgi:hypothetical protein